MRTLCAIVTACTMPSGCIYSALAVGGALEASGVDPIKSSAEAQERRANAVENEAAERKREHDNEQTRATGRRLRAERERVEARRMAETRGTNDVEVEPQPAGLPPALDAAMVMGAVANVKTEVMSCRAQSVVNGQVLVFVKVAPGGNVMSVTVQTAPDPALGKCVAAAVQQATFAATEAGGSFRYPFLF